MVISPRNVIAGFVSGALAVIAFHQCAYALMANWGLVNGRPWRLDTTVAPFAVPDLVNQAFWGGLWGILFALVIDRMPRVPNWVNGMIFGMVFPMLLGSWIIVSLIKGRPLFSGYLTDFDITRLRNGFVLNGVAFGLGLGLIYSWMPSRGGDSFYGGPPASSAGLIPGYVSFAVSLAILGAALSGLVLRGTSSSPLLVLLGLVAMVLAIRQMSQSST